MAEPLKPTHPDRPPAIWQASYGVDGIANVAQLRGHTEMQIPLPGATQHEHQGDNLPEPGFNLRFRHSAQSSNG